MSTGTTFVDRLRAREREAKAAAMRKAAIERHETAQEKCSRIRMYRSPWVNTPDGCRTRFVRQIAEVE